MIKFSEWLGAYDRLSKANSGIELKDGICVCFVGIDGSGKTTHAIGLSKSLSKIGINSDYIRPEGVLVSCLPRTLVGLLSRRVFVPSKMIESKPNKYVGHQAGDLGLDIVKSALTFVFLIYAWLTYFLVIKPRLSKRVLIYDRYFYDWIYTINRECSIALMRLVPKADLTFLLDLGIEDAFSRMHSFEDKRFSADYYSHLRIWYLKLAEAFGFYIINSICDYNTTKQMILKHTMSSLTIRGLIVS